MKKLSIWGVGKLAMKAGLLITLIFVGMNVGALYVDYKEDNPEGNLVSFFLHEEVEEYNQLYGAPSPEFVNKVDMYYKTTRSIWFALFFFSMFENFHNILISFACYEWIKNQFTFRKSQQLRYTYL